MRTNLLRAGLTAAILLNGLMTLLAQSQAQSSARPGLHDVSGQPISIVGTVKRVSIRLSRVLIAGNDGRNYLLDISHAKITPPGNSFSQLVPGTEAYVSGRHRTGGSIVVSRLQVLPVPGTAFSAGIPTVTQTGEPPDLTVRGTVAALDFEGGSFVLRINTHTRIVFVTADTDVTGLGRMESSQFPVQPGQRVTVGGSLQPNGTVLAGLLTLKANVNYVTAPGLPNRILVGTVSSAPDKLRGRDIKIRPADGTETKVQIPRGIPIQREGRSISVYNLSRRDMVRITGRIHGIDFHAARIDVLAPLPSDSPSRPGL